MFNPAYAIMVTNERGQIVHFSSYKDRADAPTIEGIKKALSENPSSIISSVDKLYFTECVMSYTQSSVSITSTANFLPPVLLNPSDTHKTEERNNANRY